MVRLDWSRIGWNSPERPDDVSRETINQLTPYFAGRPTAFTILLRLTEVSQARHQWLDLMANIAFDTTINYATFVAAACTVYATNLIPIIYPCDCVEQKMVR